jgi:hypothetical protein
MAKGSSKPVKKARHTSVKTRAYLFARAAGRCEFDNCGRYLLEHYPTFTPGNFAEQAHIWAFSEAGPRGNTGLEAGADLNGFENLMLLCKPCHKLIDEHPERYTVEVLRSFKRAHEDAVFERTGLKRDSSTVALVMKANIGDQRVVITAPHMQDAVKPRYLSPRAVHEIDLTSLRDRVPDVGYLQVAADQIRESVQRLYETTFDGAPATHVSVFALAPIPLLIFLGSCISNKVSTDLFQRHRDTEDWVWKAEGPLAGFEMQVAQVGTEPSRVALILSLSGQIRRPDLPESIDERFTVYELRLTSEEPNPRFLRTRQDLEAFRDAYSRALRAVGGDHEELKEIHLFPAVPAPIAVAVGRDLLPKVDPTLVIYDNNKNEGGFTRTLEANVQ